MTIATSIDNLHERRNQGFSAIGLGMDTGLLLRSLKASLGAVGRDAAIRASLAPDESAMPPTSTTPSKTGKEEGRA